MNKSNGKITILNVDVDASVTAHFADDYRICGTCEIRIKSAVPVTSVSLSQTSINMEVGQRVDFTSTIAPANASNKRLTWDVYDDLIASVYQSKMSSNSDWFILAWRPGTITLRLLSRYDETIYATCTVTVTETCEHEFDDGIVRYEPTCTEEGAKTGTIYHDAEYETKWVEDTPAYDICTVCGTTKE